MSTLISNGNTTTTFLSAIIEVVGKNLWILDSSNQEASALFLRVMRVILGSLSIHAAQNEVSLDSVVVTFRNIAKTTRFLLRLCSKVTWLRLLYSVCS
jgi:hypothetical protein